MRTGAQLPRCLHHDPPKFSIQSSLGQNKTPSGQVVGAHPRLVTYLGWKKVSSFWRWFWFWWWFQGRVDGCVNKIINKYCNRNRNKHYLPATQPEDSMTPQSSRSPNELFASDDV